MNGLGVVMTLSKSPDLKLVEPEMIDAPKGQPHPSRLSQSFPTEGVNTGVLTMDGDRMRLTWRGYFVIVVAVMLIIASYFVGNSRGESYGIVVGREQREKEFILKSIDQINNIKTAQEMFPDQTPKEKK